MKKQFNIISIIEKKINKKELLKEEIEYFVENYTNGKIPDYQAASLITAIKINQMTTNETNYLTNAMIKSGKVLDLSHISNEIYDKHSTGGVGDKVTIVLIPILASLGFKFAKMSGRGLGYTGGTVDKFESIPNFKINLELDEFINNLEKKGMAITSQTNMLVPADKKIYNLRDTIACTDSIPLIASSIMSKKIAAGANNILLDITYGEGAFMKTKKEAILLKEEMEKIAQNSNINLVSVITSMREPLGYCVGNSLEVLEAMAFLNGEDIPDLKEVVYKLCVEALYIKYPNMTVTKAIEIIDETILSKKAYKKFIELVENQNGDLVKFKTIAKLQNSKENAYKIFAKKSGTIKFINAKNIAKASFISGSGRLKKEDNIDYYSGIALNFKSGSTVTKGDILAYVFLGDETKKNAGFAWNSKGILAIINEIEKELEEGIIIE